MRTAIGKRSRKPRPDMLSHRRRDANAARFRETLQARRNIDRIAEKIAASDHHVAEMQADAQSHPRVRRGGFVMLLYRLLNRESAGKAVGNAREFRED